MSVLRSHRRESVWIRRELWALRPTTSARVIDSLRRTSLDQDRHPGLGDLDDSVSAVISAHGESARTTRCRDRVAPVR